MTARELATVREVEGLLRAAPPLRVWVSYCSRCGVPIVADTKRHGASCPDCPLEPDMGPAVLLARYALEVPTRHRRTTR